MEFAPIVLLGARPEVVTFKIIIDAVWGMYIHSNIDVRSGVLQRFFNGPEMHRWHHAIEITEGGINFGTKLAIWDYLFGTAVRPAVKPRGYGLSDVDFPTNVLGDDDHVVDRRRIQRLVATVVGAVVTYFVQLVFAFRRFAEPAAVVPASAMAHMPEDPSR